MGLREKPQRPEAHDPLHIPAASPSGAELSKKRPFDDTTVQPVGASHATNDDLAAAEVAAEAAAQDAAAEAAAAAKRLRRGRVAKVSAKPVEYPGGFTVGNVVWAKVRNVPFSVSPVRARR